MATFAAARDVAAGVVALGLLLVAARPRAAAWGRLAVVTGGACAAVWMVAERAVQGGRPAGPFGNPNGSATVVLLALALAPSLRLPLGARVSLMALAAAGVAASGSRAALIGACLVAAAWGFAGRRRRALAVAAGAVAAAAALGLAARLALDRDPLRYERLRIWGVVARVAVAEFPFGCGPGGYADAALAHNFPRDGEFARYARLPDLPESDLLAVPAVARDPRAPCWRPGCSRAWPPPCAAAAPRRGAWRPRSASPRRSTRSSWCPRWRGRRPWRSAACSTGRARRAAPAPAAGRRRRWPPWRSRRRRSSRSRSGARARARWRLVEAAEAAGRARRPDDAALADAEAQAWRACAARPRFARAWNALGNLRLARAGVRDEADLAAAAAAAFAAARRANPLDVWAAVGEGRARLALGDRPGARAAFAAAVRPRAELRPGVARAGVPASGAGRDRRGP